MGESTGKRGWNNVQICVASERVSTSHLSALKNCVYKSQSPAFDFSWEFRSMLWQECQFSIAGSLRAFGKTRRGDTGRAVPTPGYVMSKLTSCIPPVQLHPFANSSAQRSCTLDSAALHGEAMQGTHLPRYKPQAHGGQKPT